MFCMHEKGPEILCLLIVKKNLIFYSRVINFQVFLIKFQNNLYLYAVFLDIFYVKGYLLLRTNGIH
jgi:hypothetical protein